MAKRIKKKEKEEIAEGKTLTNNPAVVNLLNLILFPSSIPAHKMNVS